MGKNIKNLLLNYEIMKAFRFSVITVSALLFLFNHGCNKKLENAIDFGKFENGIYSNSFFKLNIKLPDTGYVMDDGTRIAFMNRGKKIVAGDNKNLKAILNAADLKNLNLITAYESPPGSPVSTNPSFIIIAENIKNAPGVKAGSDYHYHAKKLMSQSNIDVSFPKEIYKESIGGKPFDVLDSA